MFSMTLYAKRKKRDAVFMSSPAIDFDPVK